MKKKEINDLLRQQIEDETPDVWDSLLEKLEEEKRQQTAGLLSEDIKQQPFTDLQEGKTRNNRGRAYVFASAVILVAAIIVMIVSFSHGRSSFAPALPAEKEVSVQQTEQPETTVLAAVTAARVMFDVNPSIEFSVNEQEKIVDCRSLNKEGEEILQLMDLKGADVTVASYAVIGAMITKGYLTEKTNAILLSVSSAEKERGQKMEEELAEKLSRYLEDSPIKAAVIGQLVNEDDELAAFARKNEISDGKAWIIEQLIGLSEKHTEESLLKLSTQELLLLWNSKEPDTRPGASASVSYGNVSAASYIPKEKAVDEAIAYAQADLSKTENLRTEYDCDDGTFTYEVTFTFEGRSYEVEVDAKTGRVLDYDFETAGDNEMIEEAEDSEDFDDDEDRYEDEDRDDDDGEFDDADNDDNDYEDDDRDEEDNEKEEDD